MRVFRFVPGYETNVVVSGKEPLLLLLLAFLVAFALTRLYTRLARVYGWGSGNVHGVHLHHMVIGIIMILVSGVVAIAVTPASPGIEVLAIAFGVGAALTLDEFALWLYFRDVYWSEEGRSSIDATLMGFVFGALLLVGTSPFGIEEEEREFPRAIASAVIGVNVVLALVTFLKGRLMLGLLSIFLPPVGLVAALRLAKPHSPWAGWFYKRNESKLARSHTRFDSGDRRLSALKERFYDLIGGAPSDEQKRQPQPQLGGGVLSVAPSEDPSPASAEREPPESP
jgi:hypothetical protein